MNWCLGLGILGSIAGCVCVTFGHPLAANIVWVFLNPFMLIHNYKIREKMQTFLWAFFIILSVFGVWYNW